MRCCHALFLPSSPLSPLSLLSHRPPCISLLPSSEVCRHRHYSSSHFPPLSLLRCSLGGRMWSGGGRKLCQNERPRDDRRHGGGCDVSQTFCKKREGEGEERTRYSFFPPSPRLGCFRTMQRMMQRIYLSCIQVPLRARGRLKQSNNCGADDEQLASF